MKLIIKDSFYLTLSKGIRTISLLILTMLASRYLTLDENGDFRKLNLLLTLSLLIIPWGIPITVSYYYKNLSKKSKDELFSNSLFLSFIQCAVFSLIVGLIFLNVHFLQNKLDVYTIILFIVQLIITVTFAFIENFFVSSNNSKSLSIVNIIVYSIQTILVTICLITTQSLVVLISVTSIIEIFKNFILIGIFTKKYRPKMKLNRKLMHEQFIYSFPIGINSVIQTVNIYIDGLFVALLFTSSDYAIYSAGSMQIPLISIITVTLSTVALPEMSKIYHDNGNIKTMVEIWANITIVGAIIIFPVFWALLFFHKGYIEIVFSEKFFDSIPIFLIYLLKLPLSCTTFSNILLVLGKQKSIVVNSSIAITVNTILSYILLNIIGIEGAAISSLIMHVLIIILQLKQTSKYTNIGIRKLLPYKELLVILFYPGCIFLLLFIGSSILVGDSENIISFLIFSLLGIIITFLIYYKRGFIRKGLFRKKQLS